MIYTIEIATMITEQLRRFTFGYAHHVNGQFANLDFWLEEVKNALNTIDQYNKRFNKIRDAQKIWVENHGTKIYDYCPQCDGKCELSDGKPKPPHRTPQTELMEVRKELVNSTYSLLLRFYRMSLLNKDTLKLKCEFIGTNIDPDDLI